MSTVGDYLKHRQQTPITCRPEDTAQSAATLLSTNRIGAMPVLNREGNLVGVLSERDVVNAFAHRNQELSHLMVADLMTKDVITCKPETEMCDASRTMAAHRFRHLPVVEAGRLVGMISIRDALEVRLQSSELEANVLRDNVIAARYR